MRWHDINTETSMQFLVLLDSWFWYSRNCSESDTLAVVFVFDVNMILAFGIWFWFRVQQMLRFWLDTCFDLILLSRGPFDDRVDVPSYGGWVLITGEMLEMKPKSFIIEFEDSGFDVWIEVGISFLILI